MFSSSSKSDLIENGSSTSTTVVLRYMFCMSSDGNKILCPFLSLFRLCQGNYTVMSSPRSVFCVIPDWLVDTDTGEADHMNQSRPHQFKHRLSACTLTEDRGTTEAIFRHKYNPCASHNQHIKSTTNIISQNAVCSILSGQDHRCISGLVWKGLSGRGKSSRESCVMYSKWM